MAWRMKDGSGWLPALFMALVLVGPEAALAQEKPEIGLVDAAVTIDEGRGGNGDNQLLLQAKDLPPGDQGATLSVQDLGTPATADTKIAVTAHELAPAEELRRWVLIITGSGIPAEAKQQRYLDVRIGGSQATLSYELDHGSAPDFSWTLTPPPGEPALLPGAALEVAAAVAGRAATNVRLMQASFIEQSSHELVRGGWILCQAATGACPNDPVSLAAGSANRLWLRPAEEGAVVGKYAGTVMIGADQDPEGKTLALTVYGTSTGRRIGGVVVLLLGVVAAWLASTFSQNRINRYELMRPVLALGERVLPFRRRLQALPPPLDAHVAETKRRLAELDGATMLADLDGQGLIPGTIPSARPTSDTALAEYKTYLADKTDLARLVGMLITDGFEQVEKLQPSPLTQADQTESEKAADALDAIAKAAPKPDAAAADIAKIVTDYSAAISAALGGKAAAHKAGPAVSASELTVRINQLNLVVWVAFGLLATALGAYVVVFSNPGFGLAVDYLICLFWGFGLPTGAQQLSQATIGSVGTALGVPVPKPE